MKFICPKCKKESEIKFNVSNAWVIGAIEVSDSGLTKLSEVEIADPGLMHFACANCGSILPPASEEELVEWLKKRNKK